MKTRSILKCLLTLIFISSFHLLYAQDLSIERNKKGKMGLVNQNGKFVVKPKYDEIGIFENGIAKVRIKDKYGFINEKGKEILKPQFAIVEDFVNGVARVCVGAKMNKKTEELEGGKWGYINDEGQILIKPMYDDIDYFNEFNIAKTKKGKVYGWVSKFGKELVKPQYTQIGEILDGMARICKGGKMKNNKIEKGKWGFIDDGGRIVIKPKYQSAGEFKEGVAWVGKTNTFTYINKQGMEIFEGSSSNADADNGIVILEKYISKKKSKTGKRGTFYGIMDTQGNILEDFVYSEIKMNDWRWAQTLNLDDNKQYFIHNEHGKITKLKAGSLDINFKKEIEKYTLDGKQGYVKKDGTVIIVPKYRFLGDFTELINASEDNTHYGYLSQSGEIAIPFVYDYASIFNEGYATVHKADRWNVIDKNNQTILSTDADSLGIYSEGLIPAIKSNKAGFISLKGEKVIPYKYELVSSMHNSKFNYLEKGKWGIRDSKEKVLLAPTYDFISNFYDEVGNKWCYQNNKIGLINSKEKEILPTAFDIISFDSQNQIYAVGKIITGNEGPDLKEIFKEYGKGTAQEAAQSLPDNPHIDKDKIAKKVQKKMEKKGSFDVQRFIGSTRWGATDKEGNIIIELYCIDLPDRIYKTIIVEHQQKQASLNDIKYYLSHPNHYIVNYNRFKVNEVIPEELWEF